MLFPLLSLLAQIPNKALAGDDPRIEESSSILTLLLGGFLVLMALFVALKTFNFKQVQD